MQFNINNKQRLKVIYMFMLQLYKMTMGTLLILFVPQKCEENYCSTVDVISSDNHYTRFLVASNSMALFVILIMYGIELKRENWCISHLDIDNEQYMYSTVDFVLQDHQPFVKDITRLNRAYLGSIQLSLFFSLINYFLSGIYIFGSHYEDISTLTSYIGFGILIFTKLHNSYTIANKSHSKKVAISAYMKDAKVFNNIEQTKRQYYLPASFVYGQII